MSIEEIGNKYFSQFKFFRTLYGDIPVVFIHFPTKLDTRQKFKMRGEAIARLKYSFQPFYVIQADDEIVPGLEDFSYHYNKSTY